MTLQQNGKRRRVPRTGSDYQGSIARRHVSHQSRVPAPGCHPAGRLTSAAAPQTLSDVDVGIGFTPFETRSDLMVRLAVEAEALGFDHVAVPEGWTHDALIVLAEVAARTTRIGLRTGIVSAWGRTPATLAMAAAGLQRCSGGRFTLGLGAGSPPLTEGLHGVPWARPTDRLRETVTAVRALLAGERLPAVPAGARALRLGVLPDSPVPIEVAALAPPAIRLAGELADGWVPFLWARSRIDAGRELLADGERRSDAPTPTRAAMCVPVALGPDEASARRLAAWWISTYTTRMGPLYPRLLRERFGMASGVDAVLEAVAAGDEGNLSAPAEALAEEVTLFGTYDRAADAIASWSAAGADSLHLALPPNRPEEELAEMLRVVAAARPGVAAAAAS